VGWSRGGKKTHRKSCFESSAQGDTGQYLPKRCFLYLKADIFYLNCSMVKFQTTVTLEVLVPGEMIAKTCKKISQRFSALDRLKVKKELITLDGI